MINKKGEMTIQGVMIGALIFFGLMIIFFNLHGNIQASYDLEKEGNTTQFYENISHLARRVYGISENMSKTTEETQPQTYEQAGGFQLVTRSIWNVLKLFFGFIGIFYTFVTNLGIIVGIPAWLMVIAFGIITTTIAFLVINAILGRKT